MSDPGVVLERLARDDWGTAEGKRRAALVPWLVAGAAVALVLGGRLLDVGSVAEVENFVVLFTSIVVEALPFVLIGAAVSAAIEVFVSERAFERVAKLPRGLQIPGAVAGGLAFPVCECGSVPVARRLIRRGLHPTAALTFMLAAPIVSPVTIVSTAVAYQGRAATEMVLGRVGLGIIVAVTVALVLGHGRGADLIRARVAASGSDHSHGGGRASSFLDHLGADFMFMGKFVVAGAALAAALQTFVPQSVFTGVLAAPLVAVLLMMGLAFMLSLCSEADAFVAVSFIQFPLSSQLAFLVFGPVIDIKLAMLYTASFGRAATVRLLVTSALVVIAGAAIFQLVVA
jgi:uncharacterized membrane protein YraQ (UPF0718 family)